MESFRQGWNILSGHNQSFYLKTTKIIFICLFLGSLVSNGTLYFSDPIHCDIPQNVMDRDMALSVCYHSGFSAFKLNNSDLDPLLCASKNNITYYRTIGFVLICLCAFNYLPFWASRKIKAAKVLTSILPQGKFTFFRLHTF